MDCDISVVNVMEQIWKTKKYSYLKDARRNHGILFLKKGKMDYITQDRVISIKPFDVIYLPKNSRYEVRMYTEQETVETLLVNFDVSGSFSINDFFVVDDRAEKIFSVLKMMDLAFQQGENQMLLVKSYIYLCCYMLIDEFASNYDNSDYRLVKNAKKLLAYPNNYSVSEVAQKLFISSSSLLNKFKEYEKISPCQFRLQKKVDEAKQLLVSTDMSINEIAYKIGFYDTAYFYKVFKKYVGITPKKYRESYMLDLVLKN